MFIPEGFTPITESLKVENIYNTPNLEFVKEITENEKKFNVYKIETEKEMYSEYVLSPEESSKQNIKVSIDLQSNIKIKEGDYDFSNIFTFGSKNEKFKIRAGWSTHNLTDKWDLLPATSPNMVIA